MRVPQMVSDFFDWRWAPCVGLTAGSLAFVALALLVIPTRFDGEQRAGATLSSFDSPRPQSALYAAALARNLPQEPVAGQLEEARLVRAQPTPVQHSESGAAPQRGFSPILDRPEPLAPAPAPAPAPVAPPAQVPGSVVVQPEPGGPSRESTP